MFMKLETITVTVEQEPGGRYYAAVRWTRAGGREGGMRLLPGNVRNSAHAARRLSRLHLVRMERMLQACRQRSPLAKSVSGRAPSTEW